MAKAMIFGVILRDFRSSGSCRRGLRCSCTTDNPTLVQVKIQKEKEKTKTKTCIFVGVSQIIFTIIITIKTTKSIWDHLKEEYAEEDERIRSVTCITST